MAFQRGKKAEGRGKKAEGRGKKSEGRGKKAEGRGKKAEGRGKKAEGRGKKAEGRGKKAEGRGKKAEGRGTSKRSPFQRKSFAESFFEILQSQHLVYVQTICKVSHQRQTIQLCTIASPSLQSC